MKTQMDKLEAIKFLLENGDRGSEWAEAGLLHAIENIMGNTKRMLTKEILMAEIRDAKNF